MDEMTVGKIEVLAQKTLETHGLPGMALGVVQGGELVWFGGFGWGRGRPLHDLVG